MNESLAELVTAVHIVWVCVLEDLQEEFWWKFIERKACEGILVSCQLWGKLTEHKLLVSKSEEMSDIVLSCQKSSESS